MDANTEILQAAGQATYNRDLNGALQIATGLNLDANGICKKLWRKEFNEAFDEMLSVLGSHALLLPGVSGAYASTPDVAALDIVGDLDMRVEYVTTSTASQALMAKWTAAGAQRSYRQQLVPAFAVNQFHWSNNGTAEPGSNSGVVAPNLGAYRATIDVDNLAAGRTITHYRAASLDGPWTQISQDVQGTITAIFPSTAPLTVGAADAGTTQLFSGRITRAELRTGIDGAVVANPDFRALAPGTTSFADGTGKTWTIHGTAKVV